MFNPDLVIRVADLHAQRIEVVNTQRTPSAASQRSID
jgi:hypothetical protein